MVVHLNILTVKIASKEGILNPKIYTKIGKERKKGKKESVYRVVPNMNQV